MFRELGWVVAFTAILWTLVTLDRGYVAVGGEVLVGGIYYTIKYLRHDIVHMTKEVITEFWNGWEA